MIKKQRLEKFLSKHFIRYSLIPILVVEVALLVMYFSINSYISSKNINLLLGEAQSHSQAILENEANFISEKLNEVSKTALLLQNEHQTIFTNPNRFGLPNNEPKFAIAPNGVFYKTNEIGASLYYSSKTAITQKEVDKATFTEAMDISLKSVVDINPDIVAAYFNSWDNMNRLYPFIPKVYEQYGEHINMEDYNFYYLATKKHNPDKKPVWTGAYLDPAGNGWMLSCIVPIYKNDFLEGVTGLDITIDRFVKNILNRKLPYDANLFMVDKDGMILAMPEKIEELLGLKELKEHLYTDAILKTISKPEEFNLLKNKSPFAEHFKDLIKNNKTLSTLKINDNEYVTLQQNIDETNWKLMILIDKKNIFASIEYLKNLSNKVGYIAIALLLLFYIIFFYLLLKKINKFSFSITQPIIDLSKQTSQIKETNSDIKVLDTNILEISQLSQNFTEMINELNLKNKKLYDAKVFAEEANKAKDNFLANMSHELKTPLNSINVISDIMLKNKSNSLDETQLKNIQIINKCGKDLIYLITDILDLSKLDAKKINLSIEKVDIKKSIQTIYDKFYEQTKNKNLEFVLEIDENIKDIYTDLEKLKQIINNLLSNAIKFTNKGQIRLKVKNENEFIKINIEDDGIGIAQENLNEIFERFKQIDSSTTRKYGGTGLGLAISKELCKLLDIKIDVKSELNKGTTFELLLPKNLKNEIKNSIKSEEKIDSFENIKLENDAQIEKKTKESILILNNDPITFLNLITILNKKYIVKQTNSLDKLIDLKNKNENSKIMIDISKLSDLEKNLINEKLDNNLIILYSNDELNSVKEEKIEKSFKLPLSNEEINNL
ncbi:MAG: sensor histidine kinase [Arcobacter sp.]|jgi:signal transduction histidine kinase|uniref:sensor histidine kinase n=1 Tax=Arcobacter sp. TaxID=1872629 RepID=UPI002A757CC6|nr:sensor histidine kinase [Arcobacter sp.]MDY3205747.1 sensor histidine kinase [Arcobacter sp.]